MRPVLLRVSDESLLRGLKVHFERAGIFEIEEAGATMISVTRPYALDEASQRNIVGAHLRVWQAANPGAGVTLLP